jgi:hypothetical protein
MWRSSVANLDRRVTCQVLASKFGQTESTQLALYQAAGERHNMQRNHILGMVCGYYLSRFDDIAYAHLGFPT